MALVKPCVERSFFRKLVFLFPVHTPLFFRRQMHEHSLCALHSPVACVPLMCVHMQLELLYILAPQAHSWYPV